jgi:hypothetical protein
MVFTVEINSNCELRSLRAIGHLLCPIASREQACVENLGDGLFLTVANSQCASKLTRERVNFTHT